VRRAIYGLALLLVVGIAVKVALPSPHVAESRIAEAAPATSNRHRAPRPPIVKSAIETRTVSAPSVKDAAAAFAGGDYPEALAQYRALVKQHPDQPTYRALIRVLERRLATKPRGQ
jgi:hypothetical protein